MNTIIVINGPVDDLHNKISLWPPTLPFALIYPRTGSDHLWVTASDGRCCWLLSGSFPVLPPKIYENYPYESIMIWRTTYLLELSRAETLLPTQSTHPRHIGKYLVKLQIWSMSWVWYFKRFVLSNYSNILNYLWFKYTAIFNL